MVALAKPRSWRKYRSKSRRHCSTGVIRRDGSFATGIRLLLRRKSSKCLNAATSLRVGRTRRTRYRRYSAGCSDETLRRRMPRFPSQLLKQAARCTRCQSELAAYPCSLTHSVNAPRWSTRGPFGGPDKTTLLLILYFTVLTPFP